MGLSILRLLLALTTLASSALCQTSTSSFTTTIYFCSTSYQISSTSPVPTSQFYTTVHDTLKSTITSGVTTTTLANGVPKKVTSTAVVLSTATVTASTQTKTFTVTATAGASVVTITPSATTVYSTSGFFVPGSTSTTTIVPSAVTVTSTSVVSAAEATVTVTTTLAQNDKRELNIAGQPKHPHYDIERRGGYPKYVTCGSKPNDHSHDDFNNYYYESIGANGEFNRSTPAGSTVTAATPTRTSTIYATSTATAAVVTATASPSTTTDTIVNTSTPSPTTITVTVTLASSPSSTTVTTPTTSTDTASPTSTTASTCTDIIIDYGTDTYDAGDNYIQYYNGSGYIENADNPGNQLGPPYTPVYTDYPGTLDACTVLQMCAQQTDLVDYGSYYSFDLHYLLSNESWVCVGYVNPNQDASYFNVPDADATMVFGYSYNFN